MDIKVGEYVRTNRGYIYKIKKIRKSDVSEEVYVVRAHGDNYSFYLRKENITKHSKNIIDLIEVGDFINGYRILEIADMKNAEEKVFTVHRSDFKSTCKIWNEQDIEAILTHERYEENCYKTTTKQQT